VFISLLALLQSVGIHQRLSSERDNFDRLRNDTKFQDGIRSLKLHKSVVLGIANFGDKLSIR
jgi:hypothetical protein